MTSQRDRAKSWAPLDPSDWAELGLTTLTGLVPGLKPKDTEDRQGRAQKGPEETPGSRHTGKEEEQGRRGERKGSPAQAATSDGPAGAILVGSPLDPGSNEVTSKALAIPGS